MEADCGLDRGARAGELEGARPAEAVADHRDPGRVDARLLEEPVEVGPEPLTEQRRVVVERAGGRVGLIVAVGTDVNAVDVAGEGDVAEPGEHLRSDPYVVGHAVPVVQHQDGRVLTVTGGGRVSEVALHLGAGPFERDRLSVHRPGRLGHGGQQLAEGGDEEFTIHEVPSVGVGEVGRRASCWESGGVEFELVQVDAVEVPADLEAGLGLGPGAVLHPGLESGDRLGDVDVAVAGQGVGQVQRVE